MDRLTSIVSMYIHYLVQERYRNSREMPFSLIPSFMNEELGTILTSHTLIHELNQVNGSILLPSQPDRLPLSPKSVACGTKRELGLLLALCGPLLLIALLHSPQQLESGVLMILELTLPSPQRLGQHQVDCCWECWSSLLLDGLQVGAKEQVTRSYSDTIVIQDNSFNFSCVSRVVKCFFPGSTIYRILGCQGP